jgi:hypothetical protein
MPLMIVADASHHCQPVSTQRGQNSDNQQLLASELFIKRAQKTTTNVC